MQELSEIFAETERVGFAPLDSRGQLSRRELFAEN
jgi:hypothetical protein